MDGEIDDGTSSETMTDTPEETGEDQDDQNDQVFKAGTLTFEGDDYSITLDYGEDAKIPENASLSVREITAETDKEAYEACLEQAGQQVAADDKTSVDQKASRFFDIEIIVTETDSDGVEKTEKLEPSAPVSVNIQINDKPASQESGSVQSEPTVLHFAEEGVEQIDSTVTDSQSNNAEEQKTEILFEAESFSVYGVVYTVDFHYEVNGKMYEFSIPGGGFVSFYKLVEVLGISELGTQSGSEGENEEIESGNSVESTEIEAENGENTDGNAVYNVVEETGVEENEANTGAYEESINLNNVEVSEATKKFVADVASVEFSSPELVWVGKVDETSTVDGLKEANGLEVQYSAELTEEQIAEINSSTVEAGDWALISVLPFTSEESLTVTMKNGDQFVVKVTDALVPSSELDQETPYVLYGMYQGQYYALKYDGSCVLVPNNDLDALYDDENYQWYYYTEGGASQWRSPIPPNGYNYNYINLNYQSYSTAIRRDWGSNIQLEADPSGGYYFRTTSWDGRTYTLWLYYSYFFDEWRFVSGTGEGNGSITYIYKKGEAHQLTVAVDDATHGDVYLNDNDRWVTSGQTAINSNGTNATQIWAAAEDGYWFDHWELDGQEVPESDVVQIYEEDGRSYSWIAAGGLNVSNEDGHVLTAVYTPETSFTVEASPAEGGMVDKASSVRTRDGYNKEQITATAVEGYWFDHWELDGTLVEPEGGKAEISKDRSACILQQGGINVSEAEKLTAVFREKVKYTVSAVSENGEPFAAGTGTGCLVKVGEGESATTITDCELTWDGMNVQKISAIAGPGYVFKGWMVDDQEILGGAEIENKPDGSESSIAAGTLLIGSDIGDHVVKALFAQEYTFTVSTYPSGGGTVKDDSKTAGEIIYASLTSDGHNKYAITATANTGYGFMYWKLNGQPIVNEEGDYLYTDGTIPAGVLTLTSSDNVEAVFVDSVYTITVAAGSNGRVNRTSVTTESNSSANKQSLNTIIATANSNYKFAYWRVEDPNAVISWGDGYSATTSTIKPIVSKDTTVKAMFVGSNAKLYVVTVDDPTHGTIYISKELGVNNTPSSVYGATTVVGKANSSNNNDGQIEVRTINPSYKFLGWNIYYPNGSLYKSYTNTAALQKSRITSNSVDIPQDGMIIKAMFAEKPTPPAFQDDSMADLTDWANNIAATDFNADKTAEVFDYDNRIYHIEMTASSKKQAIDSSVVINFITDTSRSMYFPANITKVADVSGYAGSGNAEFGQKINNWLTSTNQSTSNVFYAITGQNGNATLYAIYYNTSNRRWEYVDASYYGSNAEDGQTRNGDAVTNMQIGDNPNNRFVYQAPPKEANKPWSRLDYLTMSVETAVKAIYAICPNAQIDLTTFNRSSSYRGTIPNNDAAIESMLRNIDVAGGTRQDLGLETALEHFTNGSSKRQIAVLITDGAPNNGSVSGVTESSIRTGAETNADILKALTDADGNHLELYTMGLSIKNVGNNESWLAGLATQDGRHAKSVETGAETEEAIKQIVNDLLTEVSLFGSMTDTVDPAFYPVDINGNPITAGVYAADGSKLAIEPTDNTPYYKWVNDNGIWTITWYNQTFAWADGITPGWKKDFYVKAKEDFLGGNKISTNYGSSNGMTATGYVKADTSVTPLSNSVTKTFEYTPYVNVDELHMDGNETEWTVYLGTEVDPETQLKLLINEIPVKQVVNVGGTTDSIYITGAGQMFYSHRSDSVDNVDEAAPVKDASQTLPLSYYADYTNLSGQNIIQVVNDAITALKQSETTSVIRDHIVYTEYDHAAGEFKVTVTKSVNSEAAVDGAPGIHETKQPGQAVETYALNVEYTPYTTGAAETYDHTTTGGSAGQITNGADANKVESENGHVINVIARGIEVIKTDSATGEEIEDNPALFKLYRALKTGETGGITIKVRGVNVSVVEVTTTDLVTGGVEGANKFANLPWYMSAFSEYDGQYFLKEESEPIGYLKLSEPVVITLTTTNAYTDLDGAQIEDVTGIPYNNTQTATLTLEVNGESQTLEEREGMFSVTVPNPPKGSLALRKAVQAIGANITSMDGLYTFSVSGPVGSAAPVTYYLDLTVVNGEMTTYKVEKYAGDNAERDTSNALEQKNGSVTDQSLGYVITDMETGIYALKELPWNLTDDSIEDDVYLSDITIVPGSGGNTNDMVARTTSVWVTADKHDEPVLTVTFVNEYAPDKVRFTVEKVWQDEAGNVLEEPWDGRISLIEFSVSQTVVGSGEERVLTFNGNERMTVDRSGRCAFLTPEEAGSATYTARWTSGGNSWQTILSGLEKKNPHGNAYSYRIEEITVRDVTGGIVTGYETTYDLSNGGGELIIENGQAVGIRSVNDGATASICNKEVKQASLIVKKLLEASDATPLNGDLTKTDGYYTFKVTGPEGVASPITKYIGITAKSTDHGESASPRYTTAYTYQMGDTEAERDAANPHPVVNGGVIIEELTPGKYTITEEGWTLSADGLMSLKDINVSSGNSNTTSIPEKKAVVYVGEGEVGSLEVSFTNCLKPYPGIEIEKIDETTRLAGKTTKYLPNAEFQILKWSGSNYQVYPNTDDSTATTDENGVAAFAGIEPGEYKIVETLTPAGYVKPESNDIYIKVTYSEATELHTITRYKEAYTGDDSVGRTVVSESENLLSVTYVQATDKSLATITVGNTPGAALPSTGGSGTNLIYHLGLLLTSFAGTGILMKRRRRSAA